MRKLLGLLGPTLVLVGGFFNAGCTVQQRAELADEVEKHVVDKLKTALPALEQSALTKAQGLVDAQEKKQYDVLDQQLAQFSVTSTDASGVETTSVKHWQDFDGDKDGHLQPIEIAKLTLFIGQQTALKVTKGEMSKADAVSTAKASGGAAVILGLLALGSRLIKKVSPASPSSPAPVAGGTPGPVPPKPA